MREVLRSAGRPLDEGTRSGLERRFGQDLSGVRVHSDGRASAAASSVEARAFAAGDRIVFRSGEYAPHTEAGRRLLAHEVTHVVQQRAGAGANAGLFLQKQSLHGNGGGLELDDNPARGAMQRAELRAQQHRSGPKEHTVEESSSDLWAAFLSGLARFDKSLMGDEPQKVGLFFYGSNSSSEGSTAARPTKDVIYLNSSGFDFTELSQIMNILVLLVSKPSEIFLTPAELKEKPVQTLFEIKEKYNEFKEAVEDLQRKHEAKERLEVSKAEAEALHKKLTGLMTQAKSEVALAQPGPKSSAKTTANTSGKSGSKSDATGEPKTGSTSVKADTAKKTEPAVTKNTAAKQKVEIGQWVAYDLNNTNQFVKHVYSDGSKRFTIGSLFTPTRDIDDPGAMDWKQVKQTPAKQIVPGKTGKTGKKNLAD